MRADRAGRGGRGGGRGGGRSRFFLAAAGFSLLVAPAARWAFVACGGRSARLGRAVRAAASGDGEDAVAAAEAKMARARAELELAEARAAAGRAQADLAEAKTATPPPGAPSEEPWLADVRLEAQPRPRRLVERGRQAAEENIAEAIDVEAEVASAAPPVIDADTVDVDDFDLSAFTGAEARPARLLKSREGASFFEVLSRLEEVTIMGNNTVLDAVLQAGIAGIWQFSAVSRAPPAEGNPAGMQNGLARDVQEVGAQVTAEDWATALASAFQEDGSAKSGDWRPLVRSLCKVQRLPDIVEAAVKWEQLYPDAVERTTGTPRGEFKDAAIAFLRTAVPADPGTWSPEEMSAAERMVDQDPRLRKIFARADAVRVNAAEAITGAFGLVPLALLGAVLAACFFCLTSGGGGGDGGGVPPPPTDGLPLVGLVK